MRRIGSFAFWVLGCSPLWCCSTDTGNTLNPYAGGSGALPPPVAGSAGTAAPGGLAGRLGVAGASAGTGAGGQLALAGSGAFDDSDGGVGEGIAGSLGSAGASAAGASAAGASAAGASAAGASGGDAAFNTCTAALKACTYEDKETGCSTARTPAIPLTGGGTWGDLDVAQGPYGSYVEWNEGKDFATPVAAGEATCSILAGTFGEPASVTADVLNLRGAELSLYTVFRPACMKDGEKYPVVTWGNGTCGQTGGYAIMLSTLASHGFVVVASNSRFTDGGNNEMLKALDFAKAANEDPNNILYGRLDLTRVGAMGHSQGASATMHAATDPRIKSVILWNGPTSASKPFLAVSGERDITNATPASLKTATDGATQPGAWLFYHKVLTTGGNVTGHLTLMEQPERVVEPLIAWWNYMLKDDAEAKKQFVGSDCGLCNKKDEYEFGQHNLP